MGPCLPSQTAQQSEQRALDKRAYEMALEADVLRREGLAGRAEAKLLYQAIVAMKPTWYRAMAHVRLATFARLEDRAWEGLGELRRAQELLDRVKVDPVKGEYDVVKATRLVLHEELARCYMELGLPDRVEADLAEYLKRARAAGADYVTEATALDVDYRLSLGEWREAVRRADLALKEAEALAAPPAAKADLELRRLLGERHIAADAAASATVARGIASLLAGPDLIEELRLRASLEMVESWIDAGDLGKALEGSLDLLAQPFETEEREAAVRGQRARIALAMDVPRSELAGLRDELAGAVQRWFDVLRSMPLRHGGHGALHFDARRAAVTSLLSLDRRVLEGDAATAAAFAHLEAALSLGTVTRRIGAPPPDLETARRDLVPAGGGLLLFFLAQQRGHLLLVDAAGSQHVEFPLGRTFYRDADNLRKAVERAPDDVSAAALARVRDGAARVAERLLPAEVRARIGAWRQVTLVGAERHGRIFQALPWGDGWWCLKTPLMHVPSASLAMALHRRAATRGADGGAGRLDLAVVGDPIVDAANAARWSVAGLDLDAGQRNAFLQPFGGNARGWWGSEATPAVLRDPAVASARALCLFTHGVQDFEREESAGLLLTGERGTGVLFADAVAKLNVPPLAVLGVCGASDGPLRFGDDGAHHLGGAFLVAGADAVVLAHGDLSLGATRELLHATFGAWRHPGTGIAEALRLARVAVAKDERRSHPYYFVGLRALGVDLTLRPK